MITNPKKYIQRLLLIVISIVLYTCKPYDIKPEHKAYNDSLNYEVLINSIIIKNDTVTIYGFGKTNQSSSLEERYKDKNIDSISIYVESPDSLRFIDQIAYSNVTKAKKISKKISDLNGDYKNQISSNFINFKENLIYTAQIILLGKSNKLYSNLVSFKIVNKQVVIINYDTKIAKSDIGIKFLKHNIISDNNSNGIANNGETVKYSVYFKNTSTSTVANLSGKVTTTSSYVKFYKDYQSSSIFYMSSMAYNDIDSGEFIIDINSNTPDGTIIPFDITLTDNLGNTIKQTLNITVGKTNLNIIYTSNKIISDNNSNGIANNGERVKYSVYFKNTSTSTVANLSGKVTTTSSYVKFYTDYQSSSSSSFYMSSNFYMSSMAYNDIDSGEFIIGINSNTPDGTIIPFVITLTDDFGNTTTQTLNITVGKTNLNIIYTSNKIISDNNSNGLANNGETVKYSVYFKNTSTSTVANLSGKVTTTSSYVNFYKDYASSSIFYMSSMAYNDIDSGEFIIDINSNTPDGTIIPFDITLTDNLGNTIKQTLNITVGKTNLNIIYTSNKIISDNNSNGIANNGETVKYSVYFKNTSTSTVANLSGKVTTTSSYVKFYTDYFYMSSMAYNDIDSGEFIIDINSNTPDETIIPFVITLTDDFGNTTTQTLNITVSRSNLNIIYISNKIISDNNSNGIANNGERLTCSVDFKNMATSTASDLTYKISTSSTYASVYSNSSYLGNLVSNSINSITYFIDINKNATDGSIIPIDITLTDNLGNTTTQTLNITVSKTNLFPIYTTNQIISDNNFNGIANNGETVKYSVFFKNMESTTVAAITSTVSTTSVNASVIQSSIEKFYSLSNIPYNAIDSTSFSVIINKNTPDGTIIPIIITLTDDLGNTTTQTFNITVVGMYPNIVDYGSYNQLTLPRGNPYGPLVTLYLTIKNIGSVKSVYPKGTLTTNSIYAYIHTLGTLPSYLDVNETFETYCDISFTDYAPKGANVPLTLTLVDEDGFTWNLNYNIIVP